MRRMLLLLCFSLLLLPGVSALEQPKYNVAFYGQLPLDVLNGFAFGGFVEYRGYRFFGFMLDLEFSKSYYNYENGEWYGPVSWIEVDASGADPWDWIFYQWNCQIHLFANIYLPAFSERSTLFLGLGPTINLIFGAESNDNYPEFNDYYEKQRRELALIPGVAFRGGIETRILPQFLYGGAGVKFRINDFRNLERDVETGGFGEYVLGHTQLFVYLMVGI